MDQPVRDEGSERPVPLLIVGPDKVQPILGDRPLVLTQNLQQQATHLAIRPGVRLPAAGSALVRWPVRPNPGAVVSNRAGVT